MYKAVNAFADQVKRVAGEDKASLAESGLGFNLYAIVGGQLEDDEEHRLYLLYPQGNWVEVGQGSPFIIIGNSGYGKPLLHRNLNYRSTMKEALKAGFLSFDATKVSTNDVDYPLDIILYNRDSFKINQYRLEREDMENISRQWNDLLVESMKKLPEDWMKPLFE
jgi:putative proteasome-type protease